MARHFMILPFCLKVVLDCNSFKDKLNRLSKACLMKNIVSPFSNSYNIRKTDPLHLNTRI